MDNRQVVQEKILLSLSLIGGVSIMPFAGYRLYQQDWFIGIMDLIASSSMLMLFYYVYTTKKIELGCKILSFVCLATVILTMYLKGAKQIYWLYPALVSVYYLLEPKLSVAYSSIAIAITLPVIYQDTTLMTFITTLLSISMTLLFAYIFSSQMNSQQQLLLQMATKDPLTGAGNRRALSEKMQQQIAAFQRTGNKVSLLLMDMDNFKYINDNFGHDVGDRLLVEVTALIRSRIRISDNLFRFGGEEFIVIAENTGLSAAQTLAEELRASIERNIIIPEADVTISIGVAELSEDQRNEQWIKHADDALMAAKSSGKNAVHAAE